MAVATEFSRFAPMPSSSRHMDFAHATEHSLLALGAEAGTLQSAYSRNPDAASDGDGVRLLQELQAVMSTVSRQVQAFASSPLESVPAPKQDPGGDRSALGDPDSSLPRGGVSSDMYHAVPGEAKPGLSADTGGTEGPSDAPGSIPDQARSLMRLWSESKEIEDRLLERWKVMGSDLAALAQLRRREALALQQMLHQSRAVLATHTAADARDRDLGPSRSRQTEDTGQAGQSSVVVPERIAHGLPDAFARGEHEQRHGSVEGLAGESRSAAVDQEPMASPEARAWLDDAAEAASQGEASHREAAQGRTDSEHDAGAGLRGLEGESHSTEGRPFGFFPKGHIPARGASDASHHADESGSLVLGVGGADFHSSGGSLKGWQQFQSGSTVHMRDGNSSHPLSHGGKGGPQVLHRDRHRGTALGEDGQSPGEGGGVENLESPPKGPVASVRGKAGLRRFVEPSATDLVDSVDMGDTVAAITAASAAAAAAVAARRAAGERDDSGDEAESPREREGGTNGKGDPRSRAEDVPDFQGQQGFGVEQGSRLEVSGDGSRDRARLGREREGLKKSPLSREGEKLIEGGVLHRGADGVTTQVGGHDEREVHDAHVPQEEVGAGRVDGSRDEAIASDAGIRNAQANQQSHSPQKARSNSIKGGPSTPISIPPRPPVRAPFVASHAHARLEASAAAQGRGMEGTTLRGSHGAAGVPGMWESPREVIIRSESTRNSHVSKILLALKTIKGQINSALGPNPISAAPSTGAAGEGRVTPSPAPVEPGDHRLGARKSSSLYLGGVDAGNSALHLASSAMPIDDANGRGSGSATNSESGVPGVSRAASSAALHLMGGDAGLGGGGVPSHSVVGPVGPTMGFLHDTVKVEEVFVEPRRHVLATATTMPLRMSNSAEDSGQGSQRSGRAMAGMRVSSATNHRRRGSRHSYSGSLSSDVSNQYVVSSPAPSVAASMDARQVERPVLSRFAMHSSATERHHSTIPEERPYIPQPFMAQSFVSHLPSLPPLLPEILGDLSAPAVSALVNDGGSGWGSEGLEHGGGKEGQLDASWQIVRYNHVDSGAGLEAGQDYRPSYVHASSSTQASSNDADSVNYGEH